MQERKGKDLLSAKTGRFQQASLLRTILGVLGWPYAALGLVKLLNDILNFAGISSIERRPNNKANHTFPLLPSFDLYSKRVILNAPASCFTEHSSAHASQF